MNMFTKVNEDNVHRISRIALYHELNYIDEVASLAKEKQVLPSQQVSHSRQNTSDRVPGAARTDN